MKNRRGLTLVEILCVTAILAVLAAILTPIFVRAKLESRVSAAKLNLRGFWQALVLYQGDNDSKVDYGEVGDMGLPPKVQGWWSFVNRYTGDYTNGFQTKQQFLPCGQLDRVGIESIGLFYMPNNYEWSKDVVKYQADTVVVMDGNCNAQGTKWLSQKMNKRSIGICLSGQVRDKSRVELTAWDQRFYR